MKIVRGVLIYYAQVAVFVVASYGLIRLLYGRTELSFLEWALILFIAFTLIYLPILVRDCWRMRKAKA
ncbi:hypothetical protein CSC70_12310 [Pseudoxanthomonas kalamensis DSM 18571]|uniref:hypothetical protein n=1 Tax=Pseudoxanthomonas kalamensis TaxID=289483 RepID=UPI001390AFAA|nr:hypothetical protein [Pseudoxanthomonas kalamensis]KAF1708878.1 hypothetical protein CSC70_12310 [Pseudoxanthomonas kalamensis DSM 18571]